MGEEKKKSEEQQGSCWYKGWFILIDSNSPLATHSGVYGLDTIKYGKSPVPDDGLKGEELDQQAIEIGQTFAKKYQDAAERERIKFEHQKELFSKLKPKVMSAKQVATLIKALREEYDAEVHEEVSVHLIPLDNVGERYELIGISDGFYPSAEAYKRYLNEVDSDTILRLPLSFDTK